MNRLSNPFVRLSASLLVALALFTGVGCNEGSNVADNGQQRPSIAQQGVDNMKADWSHLPAHLQEAIAVQEANTSSLMTIPGVIGTGVSQDANGKARITVYTSRADVRNIPHEVGGLKTHVDHIGEVVAMGKPSVGFKGTYRPVPCGVSIGNNDDCAAGTLGCLVRDGLAAATPYLLSNRHVLEGSNNGSRINQPGRYDARRCAITGQIATNYQLAPIVYDNGVTNNTIDAGIATYTGVQYTGSMVNNLYTPTSVVMPPTIGLGVKKVGRTTGLTTGSIAAINVTISVSYGTNKIAKFVGQIQVSGQFIQSGDSGSLMVTSSGNNPVGLCFAGSNVASFANPIGTVLNYFGVNVAQN